MVPDGFKDWAKPVGTGALHASTNSIRACASRSRRRATTGSRGAAISTRPRVTVINDGSARLNALISGQMDAINRVDHKAVALLSKTPKIADRARARRLARGDGDGMRQGAVRQPGYPPGAEVRDRPRADPEGAVQRLRHARQRSPDPADRSLFQQGAGAAQSTIRRRPPSIFKKAGHRRSDDPAAGLRRRLQRARSTWARWCKSSAAARPASRST